MSQDESETSDPLERARTHLRRATLEGLEAANALFEAALRSTSIRSIAPDSVTREVQRSLEQLIGAVRREQKFRLPVTLTEPLARALEAEITKWQKRSESDPDARPVLRAFLGLRELLWEIGVRTSPAHPAPDSPSAARTPAQKSGTRRVQRFDVEG